MRRHGDPQRRLARPLVLAQDLSVVRVTRLEVDVIGIRPLKQVVLGFAARADEQGVRHADVHVPGDQLFELLHLRLEHEFKSVLARQVDHPVLLLVAGP